MRTWEKDTFRQVAVAITDRFAIDATYKLTVLGSVVAAVGGSACLVAVSGGSHVLAVVKVFGKWVQSQAGRVHSVRSASSETMPAKGVLFCLWIIGSLLDDGVCCHAFERGRAWRLDDVTFQSSSCHHHRRAVNAVAG